ncbi:hypothetical protein [Nannocystis pusilla]|uniref:hypothetical protein n=1 Tax=Nannocystis pusilla TaxID=889268 RepID=UPI003B7DB2DC
MAAHDDAAEQAIVALELVVVADVAGEEDLGERGGAPVDQRELVADPRPIGEEDVALARGGAHAQAAEVAGLRQGGGEGAKDAALLGEEVGLRRGERPVHGRNMTPRPVRASEGRGRTGADPPRRGGGQDDSRAGRREGM